MAGQREILLEIVQNLDKCKIPYLLTGSFAVSYYGYPRATHDIDLIVEISPSNRQAAKSFFTSLIPKFLIDLDQVESSLEKKNMVDIFDPESGVKIDFWMVKSDFDKNKFSRSHKISIENQPITLISAEDLILTKLLWCREIRSEKHLRDCTGILKIQQNKLDYGYLSSMAAKLKVMDLLNSIKQADY